MILQGNRLFFIDWLRVIALGILWVYHTGLVFNGVMNFSIMNSESIPGLYDVLYFFHEWRLGLLFFVSGVGTYFAIKKYGSGFIKERVRRILIPLIFGVLIIVPPQIYIERIYNGFYYDSYLQFYLQSFGKGFYPYGDISWQHLWFLAYLFLYSAIVILTYSFFAKIKILLYKITPLLMIIPLIVSEALLKPYSLGVQNIVQDMAMFVSYFLIYCCGILFCSNISIFEKIQQQKHICLIAAIVLTILTYLLPLILKVAYGIYNLDYYIDSFIHSAHRWFCILAIVGYAIKYLNKENRFISATNPAVLPLYILHQTMIIVIGYPVIQWQMNPWLKFLIIVVVTLGMSYILTFFFIRRVKLLRKLFGVADWLRSCQVRLKTNK